jgi:hypothetical protein
VPGHYVIAALEQGHQDVDGGHPGGESEGMTAALQASEVALESRAGRIRGPGIFVAFIAAELLLQIRRSLVDRDDDCPGGRIGFLPHMNSVGCESHEWWKPSKIACGC